MATSEIELCNLALSSFGWTQSIQSLTEASDAARQCKLHLPHARRAVFAGGHDWACARERVSLAENGTNALSDRWAYCYTLPSDLIKIRWLEDGADGHAAYERDKQLLYCSVSPAWLRYIKDQADVGTYSPQLIEALSAALAARIVYPLTKDNALRRDAMELARMAIAQSSASEANSDINESYDSSAFIDARA